MNDITSTAQALAVLGSTDWIGLFHALPGLALSVALAWLAATPVQAGLEGLIAAALPGWAFFVKPFLPMAFSTLIAKIATLNGLPGVDAVAGATALAAATHWINSQSWAADLEGKWPKVWAWIGKGVPPTVPKALLLALGLGLLASCPAKAAINFGAIQLSPTAAPLVISVQPNIAATFYRAESGAIFSPETDDLAGLDALANWGPYHVGVTFDFDHDGTHLVDYGAAGVVAGVGGVTAMLLWRRDGALLGLTFPLGVGATAQ